MQELALNIFMSPYTKNKNIGNENSYFYREMKDHAFRMCSELLTYISHDYFMADEEKIVKQTDSINLAKDSKFLNLVREFRDQYDSYCEYVNYLNVNDFTTI